MARRVAERRLSKELMRRAAARIPGGVNSPVRAFAAVIVEPVAANMGLVLPAPGFVEGVRRITREWGALLIYDEVITGFRLGWGGAQGTFGVLPDLTCLGKIIGGGLPVGAYSGRVELMELIAPVCPVYQADTLSGNPISVGAGLAALELLEAGGVSLYEGLDTKCEWLSGAVQQAADDAGIPMTVTLLGSLSGWFFHRGARRRLRIGDRQRHAGLRSVFPRDARPGNLSCSIPV